MKIEFACHICHHPVLDSMQDCPFCASTDITQSCPDCGSWTTKIPIPWAPSGFNYACQYCAFTSGIKQQGVK